MAVPEGPPFRRPFAFAAHLPERGPRTLGQLTSMGSPIRDDHLFERRLDRSAVPGDEVEDRKIRVRSLVVRKARDFTPVGIDRFARPAETREHVAANEVEAIHTADFALRRATLSLVQNRQRFAVFLARRGDFGEKYEVRGM